MRVAIVLYIFATMMINSRSSQDDERKNTNLVRAIMINLLRNDVLLMGSDGLIGWLSTVGWSR